MTLKLSILIVIAGALLIVVSTLIGEPKSSEGYWTNEQQAELDDARNRAHHLSDHHGDPGKKQEYEAALVRFEAEREKLSDAKSRSVFVPRLLFWSGIGLAVTAGLHGVALLRVTRHGGRIVGRFYLIGRSDLIADDDVLITDAVFAPGYGKMNRETWEAMTKAARLEALFLDPVYTGKSMAGLIHLVRSGELPAGSRVLFMHTGGQPALFAYEAMLEPWLNELDPAG